MNYYSLNYASAFISGIVRALNRSVDHAAKPYRVEIADGYGLFKLASLHSHGDPCAAGLRTQLSTGGCGVHLTYAGEALLGQALENVIRL